jgi:hypothetical protein
MVQVGWDFQIDYNNWTVFTHPQIKKRNCAAMFVAAHFFFQTEILKAFVENHFAPNDIAFTTV